MKVRFDFILAGVCLILALFLWRSCKKGNDLQDFKDMYEASQDTLHKTKDALGREITSNRLLYGNVNDLLSLNSRKDSALARLQSIVTKKTLAATVLYDKTHDNGSSKTTVIIHDTIPSKDSTFYLVYPEYKTTWNEKWSKGTIIATKDSIKRDFVTYNEFSISQEWQKQKVKGHLFKQNVPIVKVTNENPNTETVNMKSFALKPPKQNKWQIFATGAVAGALGLYFLTK